MGALRVAARHGAGRARHRVEVRGLESRLHGFRIGADVEDGLLSEKMVDNMLGATLLTMEKFHEPLMRIAFGDADPETAIVDVP